MKNLFVLLLALFSLSYNNTVAQEGPSCDECREMEFRYHGCEDGKRVTKCTSDPFGDPNFRVWKKCFPVTIVRGWDPVLETNTPFRFTGDDIVGDFDVADATAQVTEAFDEWVNICGRANIDNRPSCDACVLRIFWARDAKLMGSHIQALAIARQIPVVANGECKSDCNEAYIYLNGTSEFLQLSKSGFPKNYFYTDKAANFDPEREWYSFKTTIKHEMGHWLGFDHAEATLGFDCGDPQGIMGENKSFLSPGRGLPRGTEWGFTEKDKCMFKKLYCCDIPSDVEDNRNENELEFSFEVYPNPVNTSQFNIVFPELSISSVKHISVIDASGRTVLEHNIPAGIIKSVVNLNNLANGVYVVNVSFSGFNGLTSQKVIINR